ncbi:MAG: hypothetical protein JW797_14080 [Bradymonadales bacterium]|nr:hypothetical protein [Bradymonadales bacterium]
MGRCKRTTSSARAVGICGFLTVVLALPAAVRADRCEALGVGDRDREEIERLVSRMTTTIDIGVLIAGGVLFGMDPVGSELEGVFHLAVTGGMTYAIGMDIDRYCSDPEAPLPAGLGWQLLVASNDFTDLELGALVRYHGELNLASPDLLLELGGLYRLAEGDRDAPGVLVSVGYGTQVIGVLAQGQLLFDESFTTLVVAGVRLDWYLFRLLF